MAPPPLSSTITTGTKSLVAERLLLAQSQQRVGPQYTDTAPLTLQGGQSKIQRIKMSEAEDIRAAVVENHDFQNIIESDSRRSSSVDYLDTYEDIPKETVKEFPEETKEELYQEEKEKEAYVENERKSIVLERKEAKQAAGSRTVPADDDDGGGVARREESATRIGDTTTATTATSATSTSTATGTSIDGRNENPPVGEWNSLPLLVERLRAALELSIGGRRDDEPPALPEDSGVDSEEDFRIRSSMEEALGNSKEPDLKKDLKFLEDLLLSDIQTALSRLRETLERIDVAALAKHGAASDPTSKLQLLKLVSSLLSRLQVPEETVVKIPVLPSTSLSRRRRGTRHTIGVSTEELAKARKWLEETNSLPLEEPVAPIVKEQSVTGHSVTVEKKPEEVRDKCTKDAINQRQLLEDKNKEIRESCVFRGIQQVDGIDGNSSGGESSMYQAQYRANSYQDKENNIEDSEERSRVSKLAAALRQRAELAASNAAKYGTSNKFSAKKSKIKRANTIDIPSYLKLQAESLGHETTGCVSLRKPINVGDKSFNSINVTVPSFQPKTENDRKFLALINRNNEAPVVAPVAPFKVFGNTRTMDMSALTNENWNSRFSNIKTTFDKPSVAEERESRSSLKARANKMFPGVSQTQVYSNSSQNYAPQLAKMDTSTGFRHAPSSPFRKIEKSSPGSPSKLPPSYHWPRNAPVPTNTLKEKARKMFDRENAPPSSKSSRADLEKPSFPRPPWIEHERNENRANGTVTENGKLDYRSFCKQFAPFVGKSPVMESKKLEEQRQREFAQKEMFPGVVDGKISFKMIPDKRILTHQFPPVERREPKEKFEPVKSGKERVYGENSFPDATLRGSSSVAVQTGMNEEQDEGRSFRVGPKISKGQNLVYNNASVQTSDLDRPSISDTETGKQWRHSSDSETHQRIVLDHNQNYHTVSSDSEFNSPVVVPETRPASGEQDFIFQKQAGNPIKNYQAEDNQDYSSSFVSPALSNYNQSDEVSDTVEQKTTDWPVESSTLPDDENIQNQDISPEVGVVTRYTCAIATVASSVDSPEPRSEEVPVDSRASSSPSPSQWSWSRSRPPTNETVTSEDEIRRHNLLQQSLVRRLQNEITTLNDQPNYQPSNFGQHLTVIQPRQNFNQPTSNNFNQPMSNVHQQQSYNQPANFDQPTSSQASSRFAKFLAPVPQKKPEQTRASSPSPVAVNRVIALREAYEQSPNSPPKAIQKERSPIPNGVTPIDSSDEYLVSCANKPSRSIVLSKSESWHQLAISNSYPRAPKVNVPVSTSAQGSHPKPPKPRSPSSQKLRSKQFEASSMADSVKKMEDKIRQYFDHPAEPMEHKDTSKHRRSPRFAAKGMVGLSRSRTMPGITDEKLRLLVPAPQQTPLLNVNTADVDKVFDDLFEETTRTDTQ
ncbi:hypothetical protein WH47_11832 [Habropoda laboriosa]|uniref:Uncharacterized protein n=1 Tax=Habropoda laboriosa TaxID=597456 RepID=A0A0L7R8H8_9HYME|nr:hypothetical protein WH47_11832 [Habropoda laboriosa]